LPGVVVHPGVTASPRANPAAGPGAAPVDGAFQIARMRMSLMVVPGPRLASIAVALIAAAAAPRLPAQAPNERADLERWRDSLASTSD
jgi:hypothetical protein